MSPGTVTSDGTTPIAGVTVTATPGTARARDDGRERRSSSSPGSRSARYELTFHATGYIDQTVTVSVNLVRADHGPRSS